MTLGEKFKKEFFLNQALPFGVLEFVPEHLRTSLKHSVASTVYELLLNTVLSLVVLNCSKKFLKILRFFFEVDFAFWSS